VKTDSLAQRRKLPHEVPSWVEQGARHFVTLNCGERGGAPLLQGDIADRLLDSARSYEDIGRWHVWLMLIMPDHMHCIVTFDLHRGVKRTVSDWKRYQTTHCGIEWQSDFFEHRLRDDAEFVEKAHYIRMNPVRKGLVAQPEDWRYVLDRGSAGGVAPPHGG
jgi:putative transposase